MSARSGPSCKCTCNGNRSASPLFCPKWQCPQNPLRPPHCVKRASPTDPRQIPLAALFSCSVPSVRPSVPLDSTHSRNPYNSSAHCQRKGPISFRAGQARTTRVTRKQLSGSDGAGRRRRVELAFKTLERKEGRKGARTGRAAQSKANALGWHEEEGERERGRAQRGCCEENARV